MSGVNNIRVIPIIIKMDAAHLKSVNFYLVEINNRFVLIDTGIASEACWDKLVMTLKQHNLTFSNIEAIMLTHHHSDHSGLVNRIRQISNIPVYAHPESINRLKRLPHFLRKRVQFFEQYYKKMGAQDELDNYIHYLNNAINKHTNQTITGEILPIKEGDDLYGLSVIDIPGHSPDHIAFLHQSSDTLFVGDHILKNGASHALVECNQTGKSCLSLIHYERSLKKLLKFHIKRTYPGHGEFINHTHLCIEEKLKRIDKRGQQIKRLLKTPKTAAQVGKDIYGKRYKTFFRFIMSNVVGHLERLEQRGDIKVKEKNNIMYFYNPAYGE